MIINGKDLGIKPFANLSGANLSGADLSGANLWDTNLSGADLSGANLSGANLCEANLSGANLSGANLRGASLYDANLYDANLSDANLSGVNLSGANLYGANLCEANLRGAVLSTCRGIVWADCSWSAHGECGRRLLAVRIGEADRYFCGRFAGTLAELREYIASGEERYRASRTAAVDFVAARMAEMSEGEVKR